MNAVVTAYAPPPRAPGATIAAADMTQHSALSTQPSPSPSPPSPLALLGGTFDPPHIGHLLLAECARLQFAAQTVLFLPAGDPYKKSGSAGLPTADSRRPTAANHRLAMTRLAVADNPHFAVDDRETRRPGPSYTVDTLEELHAEGHANLILILGADALADLPTWKHPERILELATIAVAPKPGFQNPKSKIQNVAIEMPPLAISSTLIRARVASGQPIRYLVVDSVMTYIRAHSLYAK